MAKGDPWGLNEESRKEPYLLGISLKYAEAMELLHFRYRKSSIAPAKLPVLPQTRRAEMPMGPMRDTAFPQSEYRMVSGNGVTRYIPIGTRSAGKAPANAKSVSEQSSGTYFSDLMKAISDKQFGKGIDAGNLAAASISQRGDAQVAGLRSNFADQMALMNQMGGYERGRINRDFDNQVASVGQNLAGTGLYNTTVQGNMAQGVNRNRAESLGQLESMLMQQQLGAQQNLGNQVAAAQDSQMGYQNQLANMMSGMYQTQATTLPTLSNQKSNSWSK